MKHLVKTEPIHGDACSQFSLAMALDMEPQEVAMEVGGWGGMCEDDIVAFLVRKGFSNGECYEVNRFMLEFKGVMVIEDGKEGHAVAYEHGKIYDPNGNIFRNAQEICDYYSMMTGTVWRTNVVMPVEPVKTREWSVG